MTTYQKIVEIIKSNLDNDDIHRSNTYKGLKKLARENYFNSPSDLIAWVVTPVARWYFDKINSCTPQEEYEKEESGTLSYNNFAKFYFSSTISYKYILANYGIEHNVIEELEMIEEYYNFLEGTIRFYGHLYHPYTTQYTRGILENGKKDPIKFAHELYSLAKRDHCRSPENRHFPDVEYEFRKISRGNIEYETVNELIILLLKDKESIFHESIFHHIAHNLLFDYYNKIDGIAPTHGNYTVVPYLEKLKKQILDTKGEIEPSLFEWILKGVNVLLKKHK